MTKQYKEKYKQIIQTSNKGSSYYLHDDVLVINLNICFTKLDNFNKYQTILKDAVFLSHKINLCNLATLCHKLDITYDSPMVLEFIKQLRILTLQQYPFVQFVQQHVNSYGEYDCCPIKNLITVNSNNNLVTVSTILMDYIKMLGYTSPQLSDILNFSKNLNIILPKDIIELLPIEKEQNNNVYKQICGVLQCSPAT